MWEMFYEGLGFDKGIEAWDFAIIFALVFVEGALSADNAAVLAALTRSLPTIEERRRSLRYGIIGAFAFRFIAVLFAAWLIDNWPLKLAGALYLVYLAVSHFLKGKSEPAEDHKLPSSNNPLFRMTLGKLSPFWRVLVLVELTDIAFSIDSITAAVAFSNKAWVVITGGILGIITMRYVAELFIKLIDVYIRLETAAFLAVGFIGLKMMTEVLYELLSGQHFETPEWCVLLGVALIFAWGFTKKKSGLEEEASLRS